jgi:hypothetical protein
MCCKVFLIAEIAKPAGQWCPHCTPGRGCRIWGDHPAQCRAFRCMWLSEAWLGPEWYPQTAKMVLTQNPQSWLLVEVDSGSPKAWMREPYLTHLRRFAAAGLPLRRPVVVFSAGEAILVLPDRHEVVMKAKSGEPLDPAAFLSRLP